MSSRRSRSGGHVDAKHVEAPSQRRVPVASAVGSRGGEQARRTRRAGEAGQTSAASRRLRRGRQPIDVLEEQAARRRPAPAAPAARACAVERLFGRSAGSRAAQGTSTNACAGVHAGGVDPCARRSRDRSPARRRSARRRRCPPRRRPADADVRRAGLRPTISVSRDELGHQAPVAHARAAAGAARCAGRAASSRARAASRRNRTRRAWSPRTAVSIVPWPEIITTSVVAVALAQLLQRLEAVDPRQPDVEQHRVERARARRPRAPPRPLSTRVDAEALVDRGSLSSAARTPGSSSTTRIRSPATSSSCRVVARPGQHAGRSRSRTARRAARCPRPGSCRDDR